MPPSYLMIGFIDIMKQLDFDFITSKEEQTADLRLLLLGYDILKEYEDYEKELDYVCRMIKTYEDEIKLYQSEFKEFSPTLGKPTDYRSGLIRKLCTLSIEIANIKLSSFEERETDLLAEMKYLNLNMMNKIQVGLNEGINAMKLSHGEETTTYTGLSVAKV